MSVYELDHHFQEQWLHPGSVSVNQSRGFSMEIGVLYFCHAMLVLAELIVCSTKGFACILTKWFWPIVMSLSLTLGSPEASCIRR